MVSDVPIGAFLSAGLDSSSIAAIMSRATQQPVRTYTITFPPKYRVGETTLDDPDVPARLARRLGCENQQIVVEPDVADCCPGSSGTWTNPLPIPPSSRPTWFAARLASKPPCCFPASAGMSFLPDIASTPHISGRRLISTFRPRPADLIEARSYSQSAGSAWYLAQRDGASIEKDGAQRGASCRRTLRHELHLSRQEQKSSLYSTALHGRSWFV